MARLESLTFGLDVDATKTAKELAKARKDFNQFAKKAGDSLKRAAKVGATALAGLTAGFVAAAKSSVDAANQLARDAASVGTSAKEYDKLAFAFRNFGLEADDVREVLFRSSEAVNELVRGSASWVEAFDEIGLELSDLRNLAPEQQFIKIADAISKVEDESQRLALLDEIYSDTGQRLGLFLKDGAEGLDAYRQQLERVGGTVDADIGKFQQFSDVLNLATTTIRNQFLNSLGDLAEEFGVVDGNFEPLIKRIGEFTRTVVVDLVTGIRDIVEFVVKWKDGFIALGVVLAGLKLAAVTQSVWALNAALGANPIVLGVGAAVLAVGGFVWFLGEIRKGFSWLQENVPKITDDIKGFVDAGQKYAGLRAQFAAQRPIAPRTRAIEDMGGAGVLRPGVSPVDSDAIDKLHEEREERRQIQNETLSFLGEQKGIIDNLLEGIRTDFSTGALTQGLVPEGTEVGGVFSTGNVRGALPLDVGDLLKEPLEEPETKNKFKEYAMALNDTIGNALQGSLQAGTFKGFLKKILGGFVQNLQNALTSAFSQGGSGGIGGIGGFFKGIFTGSFGQAHEGRIGDPADSSEQLMLLRNNETIMTPQQMAAFGANRGNVVVNITGQDFGKQFERKLMDSGQDIGRLYQEQAAEGVFA